MWMRGWREHLQNDSRVLVCTEEKQNGKIWVYAICKSSRACESLFADLQKQGWPTLGRCSHDSLWCERREE